MTEECKHDWKEEYYGLRCTKCDLFYPDNGNYFAPDDEDEEYHSYDCTCEDCLQNHPECDILYGDGTYFNYPDDEESDGASTRRADENACQNAVDQMKKRLGK